MRILHYSLETNHVHLIIEADDNEILEKGMRSFTNTLAKMLGKGRIQKERYHLHVLKTPAEAENAFRYVLLNHMKHTNHKMMKADLYSSLHTLETKESSRLLGVTIMETKIKVPIELDQPLSWLAKRAL